MGEGEEGKREERERDRDGGKGSEFVGKGLPGSPRQPSPLTPTPSSRHRAGGQHC